MYVLHFHNEHAFDNPGQCTIHGPYSDLEAAKAGLVQLAAKMNDVDFKVDPDPDCEDNDGTYAGYQTLIENDRDEDLASEIWAEIVPLSGV